MDLKLLLLSALIGGLCLSEAQQVGDQCLRAKSCGECIQAGANCGWCTDPGFFGRHRCDVPSSLEQQRCTEVQNPRGSLWVLENRPWTGSGVEPGKPGDVIQFRPQRLRLHLRSGEAQYTELTFKRAQTLQVHHMSLSSEVILENSKLPEGVTIAYTSHCKNGLVSEGENGRKCPNVSVGDEVSFSIGVTARSCPSGGNPDTVRIFALGFPEEVEIVLNFICECECHKEGQKNSPLCHSGNGTMECGACKCNEGRIGRQCECSSHNVSGEDMDGNCGNGTDICSNNGDCVCGTCECKKRENPEERYSGKFCECDNFNCDRSNNKLCGGHGRCECRRCYCDVNWTGSACDCSLDTSTCLAANKQICNGHGDCECGTCKCTNPKFQGPTCEICPTCPGVCAQHKECVQCRAFGTGEKKDTCERDCSYFNLIKVKDKGKLPQPASQSFPLMHCKERDANDCWFYYTYAVNNNTEKEVHVVETLEANKQIFNKRGDCECGTCKCNDPKFQGPTCEI